jgi:hypothetical protein
VKSRPLCGCLQSFLTAIPHLKLMRLLVIHKNYCRRAARPSGNKLADVYFAFNLAEELQSLLTTAPSAVLFFP